MESSMRRKKQVDCLADQAAFQWYWMRDDGVMLIARANERHSLTWSGSSTWEGERWVRDEDREDVP